MMQRVHFNVSNGTAIKNDHRQTTISLHRGCFCLWNLKVFFRNAADVSLHLYDTSQSTDVTFGVRKTVDFEESLL